VLILGPTRTELTTSLHLHQICCDQGIVRRQRLHVSQFFEMLDAHPGGRIAHFREPHRLDFTDRLIGLFEMIMHYRKYLCINRLQLGGA
jgi:hypothetical protein